jgi:phosphate transport system substrate-binding protein
MRNFVLAPVAAIGAALLLTGGALAADISGAGSTFIYPLFSKWADTYKTETGAGLNYQSIGSGGGIKQVEAKTVTFGATDKPLGAEELDKNGLTQFPMIMGGIVPIVNVEGVSANQVTLDGPTLAGIFLGTITSWNDPAIAALNSGVTLPDAAIAVVHRSDGSGTSFNFTNYLSKVSPDWADQVGSDTAVEWPLGLGAKGNEGVASTVKQTAGSIGYVEFAYAEQNKLAYTKLTNAAGKAVSPSIEAFQAAAASADWSSAPSYAVIMTNQPGDASWPITATTWVLIHKAPDDAAATGEALKFFDWAYSKGDDAAKALDYVAIPDSVVDLVHKTWASDIMADGKPVFTPAG